jgi:hypothetical protein
MPSAASAETMGLSDSANAFACSACRWRRIAKAINDWKVHKNGQAHRSRLVQLLGRNPAADLNRHGQELEEEFRRALEAAERKTGPQKQATGGRVVAKETGEVNDARSSFLETAAKRQRRLGYMLGGRMGLFGTAKPIPAKRLSCACASVLCQPPAPDVRGVPGAGVLAQNPISLFRPAKTKRDARQLTLTVGEGQEGLSQPRFPMELGTMGQN